MALTIEQFPYTGPYGLASGPLKSKGPTAEALKRFFWHVGKIPTDEAHDFDQHYNRMLWELVADLKIRQGLRSKSLPRDGSYTKEVCQHMRTRRIPAGQPNAGKYALDPYSRKIVQDEAGIIASSREVQKVQFYIREFWLAAIAANNRWWYTQRRPGDVTQINPSTGGGSDCSLMVIQSFRYAQEKSGIVVPDPAKWDYKGYGNTDWYEDDWPKIGPPFRIGDLAHFHSARHVICCIKAGTVQTAEWGSNGSDREPLMHRLPSYYRWPEEYMFTVRPPLTKAELADL